MTFDEFLSEKVAIAEEYACGITADEEDIARDAWEAATRNEREACAKVCEEMRNPWGDSAETADWVRATYDCAAAIRARSEEVLP